LTIDLAVVPVKRSMRTTRLRFRLLPSAMTSKQVQMALALRVPGDEMEVCRGSVG
jgi:hypothetical protein